MELSDVLKIPTMNAFFELRDKLNLTDRQRDIFLMKYSKGWTNLTIANSLEPPVSQDTVSKDLRIIREKLVAISLDNNSFG